MANFHSRLAGRHEFIVCTMRQQTTADDLTVCYRKKKQNKSKSVFHESVLVVRQQTTADDLTVCYRKKNKTNRSQFFMSLPFY